MQTFLALLFVCGLAYVIFRVILPRLNVNYGTNNMVRVVDRVGIEARKTLFVIEVTGKWMLVASSENGVQFLCELDAEEAKLAEQKLLKKPGLETGSALGKTFSDKLNEVISRNQGGK